MGRNSLNIHHLRRCAGAVCLVLSVGASGVLPVDTMLTRLADAVIPVQQANAAPASYMEPYVWGGKVISSLPYAQYGAPTVGSTPLSTTSPAGGGTIGATVDDAGPLSKLRQLTAFNGGTVRFFAEGGSGRTIAHTLAAVTNAAGIDEVWSWGNNTYGQLGRGDTVGTALPVRASWTPLAGETIVELAVGERHSMMLTLQGSTRRVYAWGSNQFGQTGISGLAVTSASKQTVPQLVSALTSSAVVSIAAGQYHSLAADSSGGVWVWGRDGETYGNLGTAGGASRVVPHLLTDSAMGLRSASAVSYSITNNLATVNTGSNHYFELGETASVGIGVTLLDGSKTLSKVTSTSFSYTAQPDVSLAAASGATVSYTNGTAAVTNKVVSSNVATLTVGSGHNFKVGNVVTVNIGDTAFDGQRTLTGVGTSTIVFRSQDDVAETNVSSATATYSPSSANVTNKVLAGSTTASTATLTVGAGHNFRVGNVVTVNIGDPAFDGNKTLTAVNTSTGTISYTAQDTVGSTPLSPSGSVTVLSPTSAIVTNRVLTVPTAPTAYARLTVPTNHNFKVGNIVDVDITGSDEAAFDGRVAITAVGSTSIDYARAGASAVVTGATTGTVTLVNSALSASSYSVSGTNVATIDVGANHGLAVGNSIDVSGIAANIDGIKTITAAPVGGTTVSFQAQSSITSGVATGTVAFATPSFSVSKKQIVGSTNLAYLTLGAHDVRVGNTIVVSGVDALLDGVKSVSSYDANRIVYRARDNISSVAATGTVAMAAPTLNVTHRQIAGNYAYLTLGASHGLIKGNTINIVGLGGNFDGNKTVYSVDATRISYVAQENITLTTLSPAGTASITTCSGSCPTVPAGVVEVAAGHGFSMARTASQVFTWGFGGTNWYSRLGRSNRTVTTPSAVTLPGACNSPAAITAGPFNGAVTCANNTVATWGYNGYGNLGTNVSASTEVAAPAAVAWAAGGITLGAGENIARVAMNNYGGLALTSTGRLFSWGRNYYRLLGTNSTYSAQNLSRVPVAAARIVPTGGASVEEIHSNMQSSLVLDSAGVVWSWGHAGSGILGRGAYGPVGADGSRFYRLGVPSTARISQVDTTYYGTVIVMSDESVWTLGSNGGAKTTYFNGDGTTGSTFLPARIDLPYGFDTSLSSATTRQLSCSSYHCLVATSNGSIYGWGDGAGYQLVLNSVSDRSTPTLIKSGLTNPRVAAGHSYSLYVDIGASGTGGTVYAWGSNTSRRAIPQAATATLTAFTAVQDTLASSTPSDVVAISAGTFHSVALRANGTLMVWGSNSYGQLGRGDLTTAYIFKPALPGGKVAASIHAAANHTLVLATDGTLVGWGYNATGVLGSGSIATLTSPTNVATGHRFRSIDTMGVSTTKQMHTAVGLTTSGAVMTWGANTYGQLGRLDRPAAGSGVNFYSAVPVAAQTSDATDISGVDAVTTGGWWSGAYQRVSAELAPSAPLGVSATSPAASTINVSWSPPASPRDLTGYVIHVSRGGTRVFSAGAGRGVTSLSMTAPNLDILNGQTHSIVVHAVNDAGEGDASGVVTATPVAVPGVVENLVAVPLVNGLNVDFDAPVDDGGSQVLDYEVEVVTAVGSTQVALQTVAHPSPALGTDITSGLAAGTSYVVRVRARNAEGYGPVDTSEVVVPGRPTAPRDVQVVSANASLNVTWTAPTSNGGVAISSYVATAYTVGTTTVVGTPAVVTSGTAATITGLTNGSTYDIRVAASHDSTGATLRGLESDTVKGVPGRPTQPTGLAATATASQTLVVTWNKVADVPGITVAGYRLTFVNGTTSSTTYYSTTSCPASPCTYSATGLTNGTNYTISVAGYVAGPSYGLASETITARAMGAAGAPTVEAEIADGSAVVSITAPASTGGTDITGYTVSVSPTPADAYETALDSAPQPFTLTGLTNGTTYTVTVKAVNAMGESVAGTDTVVPATVPSSPQSVRARPGSIVVTWTVPGSTGGASVTHYVISVTDSDGVSTQFSTATSNPTGTTSCTTAGRTCTINSVFTSESPETLTTIPNDMEYRVEVSAANAQGVGDPSSTYVLVSGQPDLPTNVEARGGVDVIELCWTPPAGVLTAYQVDLSRGSYASTVTVDVGVLSSPSWCTSPKVGFSFGTDDDGVDVVVGALHSLTVKATVSTSDYVFGVPSEEVEATPYGLPGAPSIQSITTTASTATVTWSAAAPRGSAVTAYTAYAMPTGESCSWTTGALSCTITNLTGNDTYGFYVEATNTAGVGPPSAVVNATIDATKPAPTWSAPEMGSSRRLAYTATFDEIIYYRVTFDEVVSGFALIDGDLVNAGTAPGCSFGMTPQGSRAYDISVQCSGTGTLIAQVVADAVVDQSANTGPLSNVNAALVTLYDPSTTSTSSSTAPTTAPTTVAPSTSLLTSTTTIDDDERASAARATTTTAPSAPPTGGATTVPGARSSTRTTVGSSQGDSADNELPPSIDSRLPNEEIASPDKLDAGDSTSLEKCGFVPGEPVRVYVGSSVVQQVSADTSGCVVVDILIDKSKNGRVAVALFAPQSKRGAKVSLLVRGSLAATGSNSGAPLGVALMLVVAGLVVLAARRKKRRTT